MNKHKHYQVIRAYADGWEIEFFDSDYTWTKASSPSFYLTHQYRVVPDAEGWLPWYGGECPVSKAQKVKVKFEDGSAGERLSSSVSWLDHNLIAYKPVEGPKQKVKSGGGIMKPFDLEKAKAGEPICDSGGAPMHFVGVSIKNSPVVQWVGNNSLYAVDNGTLFMASKKRTVWVNFYCTGESRYYDEEAIADSSCGTCRIGDKAYPVEVEES